MFHRGIPVERNLGIEKDFIIPKEISSSLDLRVFKKTDVEKETDN